MGGLACPVLCLGSSPLLLLAVDGDAEVCPCTPGILWSICTEVMKFGVFLESVTAKICSEYCMTYGLDLVLKLQMLACLGAIKL